MGKCGHGFEAQKAWKISSLYAYYTRHRWRAPGVCGKTGGTNLRGLSSSTLAASTALTLISFSPLDRHPARGSRSSTQWSSSQPADRTHFTLLPQKSKGKETNFRPRRRKEVSGAGSNFRRRTKSNSRSNTYNNGEVRQTYTSHGREAQMGR